MRHGAARSFSRRGSRDVANRGHGNIETPADLAAGFRHLGRLGAGRVEFGGEPRPVVAQRMELRLQRLLMALRLPPPVERIGQAVERRVEALGCRLDGAKLGGTVLQRIHNAGY